MRMHAHTHTHTCKKVSSLQLQFVHGHLVQGHDEASSSELLYYNSISSLPMLAMLVWVTGEASALPSAYAMVSVGTQAQCS